MPGTKVGAGGPAGYPTLRTLTLTAHLQQAGVEVFGQGSRKESLILKVQVWFAPFCQNAAAAAAMTAVVAAMAAAAAAASVLSSPLLSLT